MKKVFQETLLGIFYLSVLVTGIFYFYACKKKDYSQDQAGGPAVADTFFVVKPGADSLVTDIKNGALVDSLPPKKINCISKK